jgi:adenylylsulfate kinase
VGANGLTLWLTGLSGAGKSTLAEELRGALVSRNLRVEILDGDQIRRALCRDLGFSKNDRDANVYRIGYVAHLLSRNGVIAIASAISPYRDTRAAVRQLHTATFVEIYVECPIAELVRRDPKGLYSRALAGDIQNFTGISDPYEPPVSPDIHVYTDRETAEESCCKIISWLSQRAYL